MSHSKLTPIIREELSNMLKEADKKADKIDKELEAVRKKLKKTLKKEADSLSPTERTTRPVKRVQIDTVAKMIDVPLNELMLHFLNRIKTKNESSLIEYRLGHVYFYAD